MKPKFAILFVLGALVLFGGCTQTRKYYKSNEAEQKAMKKIVTKEAKAISTQEVEAAVKPIKEEMKAKDEKIAKLETAKDEGLKKNEVLAKQYDVLKKQLALVVEKAEKEKSLEPGEAAGEIDGEEQELESLEKIEKEPATKAENMGSTEDQCGSVTGGGEDAAEQVANAAKIPAIETVDEKPPCQGKMEADEDCAGISGGDKPGEPGGEIDLGDDVNPVPTSRPSEPETAEEVPD